MNKKNKGLCLTLALLLIVGLVLSACSKQESPNSSSSPEVKSNASPSETSKAKLDKVTLKFVLLGEAPKDNAAVMAEVNKKLEADINATIELSYIPFADISTKYPLVLASPQDWDVIFGNVNYVSNATKGGYREITMADVEKFMPLSNKATTKSMWTDTLVNGKIYMIPQSFKELDVGTAFYREDLRKKYNVPEIKTFKDLGPYLQAIKDNEKGMLPIDGTSDDIKNLFGGMLQGWGSFKVQNLVNFNIENKDYKMMGLLDPEFAAIYTDAAKTMKDWADKGLLPKNAFTQKTPATDLGKVGKSGLWMTAFENYAQYSSDMAANGWSLGALNNLPPGGTALLRPATGNGLSLSPKTKNYERALMAIDLLHQDKSYNMLLAFGIEGKNYKMVDGKLSVLNAEANPYPMYGAGWWSNNRDQWPPLTSYTQQYIDTKKALLEHVSPYLLSGFNVDETTIKTEMANISNVYKQYAIPIELGIVKDVDAAVADLIDKYKKAGAQKVVDEVKKQAADFIKSKKTN
ncbi:ABC transporter substrate-binding protein [Paenibacillus aurantius]|uniref:ABC transporter substrate-binding protein n=1 Tax=Paenibacillus aurantius TaxID=2918900 RepID=A0AA96LH61_9BACL|nr:ABC transporter substrate-binding protein [Paenibacillus aurantius]WNQ12903.1 ABC transporter substrate-binding protein [Paenibacillus aurantius]